MNCNVNSGLGVIMMYQCRFIGSKKCTTLVGNVDNAERDSACVRTGGIREISVLSPQFNCGLKIVLQR